MSKSLANTSRLIGGQTENASTGLLARLRGTYIPLIVLSLGISGWKIREETPYLPGSDLGYFLGISGGLLMLSLLLYPLRKRIRWLQICGPLRHWFRFHMLAGILGPVLVLYHSTFRVESMNAAVALACMLLVAASGIVGRFIYRRIHNGLFGSKANLKELEKNLVQELEHIRPLLASKPALDRELQGFIDLLAHPPQSHLGRLRHFLTLGLLRLHSEHRIRKIAFQSTGSAQEHQQLILQLTPLVDNIAEILKVAQKAAQFTTYERLFSLWHVVHIPFLCLLLITAIIHVVAVHLY